MCFSFSFGLYFFESSAQTNHSVWEKKGTTTTQQQINLQTKYANYDVIKIAFKLTFKAIRKIRQVFDWMSRGCVRATEIECMVGKIWELQKRAYGNPTW